MPTCPTHKCVLKPIGTLSFVCPRCEKTSKKRSDAQKRRFLKKSERNKISLSVKELFKDRTRHPFYNKKHKEKTKRLFSRLRKGKGLGSDNSNWRGGTSSHLRDFRHSDWREKVFNRDKFKCCSCGQIGGQLEAHHLFSYKGFPELRYDIENGITLCKECHTLFHSIYGRSENTKEQFVKFMESQHALSYA